MKEDDGCNDVECMRFWERWARHSSLLLPLPPTRSWPPHTLLDRSGGDERTQPSRARALSVLLSQYCPSQRTDNVLTVAQREASEESNAETSELDDADDTASLSATSVGGSSIELTSIPSFVHPRAPQAVAGAVRRNPNAPVTSVLGRPLPETDGEGDVSEGSAGRESLPLPVALAQHTAGGGRRVWQGRSS